MIHNQNYTLSKSSKLKSLEEKNSSQRKHYLPKIRFIYVSNLKSITSQYLLHGFNMNPRLAQKPQIGNNPNPLTVQWIKIYGIFILWNIMQLLTIKQMTLT